MGGRSSTHTYEYRTIYLPAEPAPIKAKRPIQELREEAQRELEIDTVNNYNIAFAGGTKHGKSTLINALRHVKKGEVGFAETGTFETTMKISSYEYPNIKQFVALQHVKLWDIPGAGTDKFTAEDYSEKQKLYAFDFIVIMTAETLTENDTNFARQVAEFNVPFAFVRSKCDESLRNNVRDEDIELTKEVKNNLRIKGEKVFRDYLVNHNELREAKVFFISGPVMAGRAGYAPYRMDELELLKYILKRMMERRNPDQDFNEYLQDLADILGIKYLKQKIEEILPDIDVD